MIKLHNSLTKQIEKLTPLKTGEVSIYTCGPTTYDHVQIGNLRTYIFDDLLRRVLMTNGLGVNHVMNITDVDDKTIKRSHEDYPNDEPQVALHKLTRHFEKIFLDDAANVGIDLSKTKIARATEHINQMQQLIKQIPNKYVGDDGINFV